MEEDICPDTGLVRDDCPCMWCSPPIFFFKYLLSDYECKNIDDVISALREKREFFEKIRDDGFRLMGPVEDHWAEFEAPESDDFYWVECRSSGCFLKIAKGEVPPQVCPTCGKNLYEHEA
jgi:hypothetical protein